MIHSLLPPQVRWGLKWTCAQLLWRTGLLRIAARLILRHRAVVLTYHRVLPPDAMATSWSSPGMVVSTATFERHLRLLRTVFRPLALDEFAAHLETQQPFRGPVCLITFDDGWQDTLDEAVPLLKKYDVPGVLFVPVACLGSKGGFWQEQMGRQLFRAWRLAQADAVTASLLRTILAEHGIAPILDLPPDEVHDGVLATISTLKGRGGAEAHRLLARLDREFPRDIADGSPDNLMDREGVRMAAAAGMAIGGHGATHRILTELETAEAAEEARRSITDLRTLVPQQVLAYSYPNGNWSPDIAEATRLAGYSLAFTTRPGPVSATDDHMSLSRVNIHEGATASPQMFLARAVGLF